MSNIANIYLFYFRNCYCSTSDSDNCHMAGLNGPQTSSAGWGVMRGSRASGTAIGRVRRGATAVATAKTVARYRGRSARGPVRRFHIWRMAHRDQSLNWKWWHGSRATGIALGCLRRDPTAGAMAMNADAMVARLDLVKINIVIYHHTDSHKSGCNHCTAILTD